MSKSPLLAHRRRELALLLGVLAGAFSLVSIAGFHPADPTWLHPGPGRAENVFGPLGALVSDLLVTLFGYGAYAIVIPMLAGVWLIARRSVGSSGAWFLGVALWASLLSLLEVGAYFWPGEGAFPPGGVLGAVIASSLVELVGYFGATFLLACVVLFCVTILGHIDWPALAGWAVERAEALWPPLREFLDRTGRTTGGVAAETTRLGARGLATGARSVGSATFSGFTAGAESLGAMTRRGGYAMQRMWRSLRRAEEDREPDWTGPGTDAWPTFDMAMLEAEGESTADETRAVEARIEVVEVEWDPTIAGVPSAEPQEILGLFPDFAKRRDSSVEEPRDDTVEDERTAESTPEPPAAAAESAVPSMAAPVFVAHHATDPGPVPAGNGPKAEVAQGEPTITPVASRGGPSDAAAVVHDNEFLEDKARDDGRALRKRNALGQVRLPALKLLDVIPDQNASYEPEELRRLARVVEEKLETFKIGGTVTGIRPGPVVTIFEFQPDAGIRVNRIAKLGDDLAMAMEVMSVRIVAPIPGRGVVGIEIPSQHRQTIYLRQLFASDDFKGHKGALPVVIGKDVEGRPVVADLAKMPHLLVGGTTGSGKSVGVNGMLLSLLFTKGPDELRLLLVDPKMLEFDPYRDIPHLLHPIITEPKKAAAALAWACDEMDDRYRLLARWGTRNIASFNEKLERESKKWTPDKARKYADPEAPCPEDARPPAKMPYIVVVIDELADLMMMSKQEAKEAETSIVRIAQKARACGIHLIVATQRPSADVVTGLIKANLPTRISFQLRTNIDSRTILDSGGAEQLLGRGDMLYLAPGVGTLQRCHGAFVSDDEVNRVNDYLRSECPPDYVIDISAPATPNAAGSSGDRDELFQDAVNIVLREGKASTSMLQRHMKIGYNRAARIIDDLESEGIIGPADGARPREILV